MEFMHDAEGTRMEERHYQIVGLLGFIIAGFIFIAVGIRFGDALTVIGSAVWTLSCVIWMIPLVRRRQE